MFGGRNDKRQNIKPECLIGLVEEIQTQLANNIPISPELAQRVGAVVYNKSDKIVDLVCSVEDCRNECVYSLGDMAVVELICMKSPDHCVSMNNIIDIATLPLYESMN